MIVKSALHRLDLQLLYLGLSFLLVTSCFSFLHLSLLLWILNFPKKTLRVFIKVNIEFNYLILSLTSLRLFSLSSAAFSALMAWIDFQWFSATRVLFLSALALASLDNLYLLTLSRQ